MPLQTVEPLRLYRQIAGQIAAVIENGEFAPGSRLPAERELAALLGVSRTSVREAIISLEIAGLVDVRVGSGIFVTGGTAHAGSGAGADAGPRPDELLAARQLVEGEIAALAADMATAADLSALRANVEQMGAAVTDFALRDHADREFHVGLARATGNGSLRQVVEGLWHQRAELRQRTRLRVPARALAATTVRDHAMILEAVASGDARGAREAMHRHLATVEREFQGDGDAGALPARAAAPAARRVKSV